MTHKGLVIIPITEIGWDMNHAAITDALAQLDGHVQVLAVCQQLPDGTRGRLEFMAEGEPRLRCWFHDPALPSLSATWNRALDYAWETGHADAMVWNNDVRVGTWMYGRLRGVAETHGLQFVSPINVRDQADTNWQDAPAQATVDLGGPDFSCFLITWTCHTEYRFDERFQPAYHEDGDYHRRLWLGGDGARIAGVTLPYLHYGSQTINQTPAQAAAFQAKFQACQQTYVRKWGGLPHQETYMVPDSPESAQMGVGTPGGFLGAIVPPGRMGDA